jgi:hypothetical protein
VRKLFATMLIAVVAALAATAPAGAARQSGLVNINVEDNVVQVPVAIAANVCDVTVAVLVSELADTGTTTCDALATSGATVTPSERGPEARQNGLINVNLQNNTVQIPIAAAANICDVDVLVLVTAILLDDATSCTARAGAAGIR